MMIDDERDDENGRICFYLHFLVDMEEAVGEVPKQRKCFPRIKKKQERMFHILCGVGAIVFGMKQDRVKKTVHQNPSI